ncbi:MAG TPA: hypothetical protein DER55_07745 [Bacteroides uniformis]|jgi:hypothetical protein|uniref:Uncharacterized protein n=2 Tax=Bacteroides uniformis TaxID=820 RepID=A0A1Y3V3D8_BACUN|nr:hypothetical protein BACUNI_00561 [Bacteroides uniformis ATCC 8492]EFA18905.1 hypothetical protein HMPREF0969_03575 [Bacteroides sp. D20]KAB3876366.1 hypothetical protein GAS34_04885 [Bacteroides uniformis]MBS1395509.1 hypothetical protein [Bacteroides sp.]QBJ19917.1 hypothetical protein EYA81_17105 [Bacteroides sp. A1C1]RGN82164.1 hypothetical protein DXB40_13895 [Bacteroides sp. 4_1_36]RJU22722.1 hypothetical protein DW012_01165 [Bacteroides sp. AF37-16AC]RJU37074.1 hypothetical protein
MLIYPIVLTAKITVSPRISAEKRYFSVLKCTILFLNAILWFECHNIRTFAATLGNCKHKPTITE